MTLYMDDAPESVLALRAEGLDIRGSGAGGALRVAMLNLMPDKRTTERQMARLLARCNVDVQLRLFVPPGHHPKGECAEYLARHYVHWQHLARDGVDALIVTGTPQEKRPFEEVRYWPEYRRILDWSRQCVTSSWFSCWGAMAALYHDHGVPKRVMREKCFGLYAQELERDSVITEGLGKRYVVPVSRHAAVSRRWVDCNKSLQVLASCSAAGAGLIAERGLRRVYMLDHPEYESDTLLGEYNRDLEAGLRPRPPRGYDLSEDATLPAAYWRNTGTQLMHNWLHQVLAMQRRPSNVRSIASRRAGIEMQPRYLGAA